MDFAAFRAIADEVGANLMVDMAHHAGLIAAGEYSDPEPYAHVVTSTTHKTMRGLRGGIILTNDEALAKKFDSAVFSGNKGGPLMHVIAAKAVAFGEALEPSFKTYAREVFANAHALSEVLIAGGLGMLSGWTDCHMVLVDLRPKSVTGKAAEAALERAGPTCNKNAIPFYPEKPFVTSGVRLGTSVDTTRGFGEAEFRKGRRACPAGDRRAVGQPRWRCGGRGRRSQGGARALRRPSDLCRTERSHVSLVFRIRQRRRGSRRHGCPTGLRDSVTPPSDAGLWGVIFRAAAIPESLNHHTDPGVLARVEYFLVSIKYEDGEFV